MKKVMIVDDTPFMRAVLRSIIESAGYAILEAENGKEAVSLYTKEKPDVVTMDIVMPEVDGIEAARIILESDPSAKIIMVSAVDSRDSLKEAIKIGVCDFIVKPFEADDMVEAIRRVLPGA